MKMFQAKIVDAETPVRSPEPLTIGTVVKLKSGGPLMVVSGHNNGVVNDYGYIGCIWFETGTELSNILRSDTFPAACLDIFEPDDSNKGE